MHALLLAAAITAAPLTPAPPDSAPVATAPLPSAPSPAAPLASALATPARQVGSSLTAGTDASGRAANPSGSVILPGIVLLGLAAAALVLARRKRALGGSRVLEVLDTTSLGPRRSLVVARVGDEALILGVSEAGIALLGSRPASALPEPAAAPPMRAAKGPAESGQVAANLRAVIERMRGAAPSPSAAAPARSFDALYAESLEDLELRRKLQQGGAGSVR